MLIDMGIECYVGVPIFDLKRETIGLVVNLYTKPLEETNFVQSILEISAINIASEIERIKYEEDLERSKTLLNETGRIAKIGGWEYDIINNQSQLD